MESILNLEKQQEQAGRLGWLFTAKRWENYLSTSLAVRIQHLLTFWPSEIAYTCISPEEEV